MQEKRCENVKRWGKEGTQRRREGGKGGEGGEGKKIR